MPKASQTFKGTAKSTLTGTPSQRGYDYQWQKLSRHIRQQRPVCEVCRNAASEDVDHVIPFLTLADPLRLDVRNLRAICRQCHTLKTRRQQ